MEEYEPLDFGFDQNGIKMEGFENTSSMATWWSQSRRERIMIDPIRLVWLLGSSDSDCPFKEIETNSTERQ